MDRSRPFPHVTATDPNSLGRVGWPQTRMGAMLLLGLVGGCAATPHPAPAPAARAAAPAVKHAASATHRTVIRAAAKVCVPEAPVLDDAQRDALFRQFQQEEAKRAGQ